MREFATNPTRMLGSVSVGRIASSWRGAASEKLIGLLLVRDEDDVLAGSLEVAQQWFDRILVLDGTTEPSRRARTDEILASCPAVVFVARDEDLPYPGRVRDGARQYLLDEARRRYGVDNWIGLLHADEFLDQDPRPMLAACRPLLDPCIRVRLVHAFLHTSDAPTWAARAEVPLRERVRHVMWPGVPETRFFFDRGTRDYQVAHHGKTVPTSFRAGRLVDGYTVVQYNERSPEQLIQRAHQRQEDGWQAGHYSRLTDAEPTVFAESLDLPEAPFAPEFAGDPLGPFEATTIDQCCAGPFAVDVDEALHDHSDSLVALAVTQLLTNPSRARAREWAAEVRARPSTLAGYPSLVHYTAWVLGNARVPHELRSRAAAEFLNRLDPPEGRPELAAL